MNNINPELGFVKRQLGIWRLTILMPSPSQNVRDRQHWSGKHSMKGLWWWAIRSAPGFLLVPRATGKRRLTVERYTRHIPQDPANVIGGCKGIVDDLVNLKLLVGDTEQWIEHGTPRQYKLGPREKEYTVLVLEDVGDI